MEPKAIIACILCIGSLVIGLSLYAGSVAIKIDSFGKNSTDYEYANVTSTTLNGFALIIIAGTPHIKNMIYSLDSSTYTKTFYYIATFIACLLTAISEVIVGIIYMVYYKSWDDGLSLALSGGTMGIISIFINRNFKSTEETQATPLESAGVEEIAVAQTENTQEIQKKASTTGLEAQIPTSLIVDKDIPDEEIVNRIDIVTK